MPAEPPDITSIDPAAVGLVHTTDAEPGLRRRRAGSGVAYRDAAGHPVRDPATLERIRRLAVPPAWTDVWICPDPRGHLQATGRDARGRKQYRYHPAWREVREASKFDQLADFGDALGELRRTVDADLRRPGLPRDKVVALVVALLDRTLIRVGNEEYRRTNGSHGLTTLYRRHLHVDGSTLRFTFPGKSGVRQEVRLDDRRLARLARRCHELGGRELFTYLDDGRLQRVDSTDCNDYLRRVVGGDTTVKTFRTWGATVTVVDDLAGGSEPDDARVLAAVDAAARRLGNTRAVARRSYVHPVVLGAAVDGDLEAAWRRARATPRLTRAEQATRTLLRP